MHQIQRREGLTGPIEMLAHFQLPPGYQHVAAQLIDVETERESGRIRMRWLDVVEDERRIHGLLPSVRLLSKIPSRFVRTMAGQKRCVTGT